MQPWGAGICLRTSLLRRLGTMPDILPVSLLQYPILDASHRSNQFNRWHELCIMAKSQQQSTLSKAIFHFFEFLLYDLFTMLFPCVARNGAVVFEWKIKLSYSVPPNRLEG